MDLKEVEWDGLDWIYVAEDGPLVGSFKHGNKLSGSTKGRVLTC
jgi:hypothetical protein